MATRPAPAVLTAIGLALAGCAGADVGPGATDAPRVAGTAPATGASPSATNASREAYLGRVRADDRLFATMTDEDLVDAGLVLCAEYGPLLDALPGRVNQAARTLVRQGHVRSFREARVIALNSGLLCADGP